MKNGILIEPKVGGANPDQVTAFADAMVLASAGVMVEDPEAAYDDEAAAELIENMANPGRVLAQVVDGRAVS
jgi:hypothetical protein